MRLARRWSERARADDGSASLEFITAGVLMLVPLVYLVIVVSSLQSAALGVEGAARQASRVFVQGETLEEARASAERAVRITLADYGLDAGEAEVAITCTPDPHECLRRRGFVTVEVSTVVPLPLVPPVLVLDVPTGIEMHAQATEQVSRFRAGL
jgi:Flp pilus assembly protein TadG